MKGCEIGHLSFKQEILGTECKPSIETGMHLAIYSGRPDVNAIVHAHPVYASVFAASEQKINSRYLTEAYFVLGEIIYAPHALMGTESLANIVARATQKGNCIVMENHGVLAVGRTILEAFDRLEVLEVAAQMTLFNLNGLAMRELTPEKCSEIDNAFR
jgi:L-fuculose-phosphate aldolase